MALLPENSVYSINILDQKIGFKQYNILFMTKTVNLIISFGFYLILKFSNS